jgi:hypothetical protein
MQHKYDKAIHGKHAKSPLQSRKVAGFEEDCKPPSTIIAKQEEENKQCHESVPILHDSDSISTNPSNAAAVTTYQSAENPPMVTPANMLPNKTIVQQNHLSHMQKNIFLQPNNPASYWSHQMHQHNDQHQPNVSTLDISLLQSEIQRKHNEDEKKELKQQIEDLKQQLILSKEKHEEVLSSYKEKYEDVKQDLHEARQNAKLLHMQNSKHHCTIL